MVMKTHRTQLLFVTVQNTLERLQPTALVSGWVVGDLDIEKWFKSC